MRIYSAFLHTVTVVCFVILTLAAWLLITDPDRVPELTCNVQTRIDAVPNYEDCLAKYDWRNE